MEVVKNELQTSSKLEEKGEDIKKTPSPTPQYDRKKDYKWQPDDIFQFNGAEYGITLNALRAIVQSPEGQKILVAAKALEIMEAALAQAVQEGVAKEMTEPKLTK